MMTISPILVLPLLFIVSTVAQGYGQVKVFLEHGSQKVEGTLEITEDAEGTYIKGKITNLKPGWHGLHIHEKGDLGDYCKAAGPHFNPDLKKHGDIIDPTRHAGDLGNIQADHNGVADIDIYDKLISLDPHSKYYIGYRAIVVHEKEDDLGKGGNEESYKTGNAGPRAGCGYISAGHLPSTIAPLHLTVGCIILAAITKRLF